MFIGLIVGIVGEIGSAKSFTLFTEGLQFADTREKMIVTNINIDIKQLYKLSCMPKDVGWLGSFFRFIKIIIYSFKLFIWSLTFKGKKPKIEFEPRLPWIKHMIENGFGIIQIPSPDHIESLMIPNSVVLLDEAGVFLNSRDFMKTSQDFLADLCQSRKDGIDFFYCAQFDDQVDKQLRQLTQWYIFCRSLTTGWNKKAKRPELYWKQTYWIAARAYSYWNKNFEKQGHFKTKFAYASRTNEGMLTSADRQLFKIFKSLDRLDKDRPGTKRPTLISTQWQSKLDSDYYKKIFSQNYKPVLDPNTNIYRLNKKYYKEPELSKDSESIPETKSYEVPQF